MRFGTTIITTPRWSRQRAAGRRIITITKARRRNSFRRRNTGICIKGSFMLAEKSQRESGVRSFREEFCGVPAEPRPGGEFPARRTAASIDRATDVAGADRVDVAESLDADAFSRGRIRGVHAIFIFCGPQSGVEQNGKERARQIS